MGRSATGPNKLDKAERQQHVAQLRRAGYKLDQIADHLGCSKTTVHRDVHDLIGRLRGEALRDTDAWVSAQLEEMQRVREAAWDAFRRSLEDPDFKQTGMLATILKAQEREAKLLGLEQTIPAVVVPVMSDEQAQQILDQLP